MSKLLRSIALPALLALTACEADPEVTKPEFPMEMATAACRWYFSCCDNMERGNLKLQATNEQACITELSGSYALMYQSADANAWDSKLAIACVDKVKAAATSCPKAYDLSGEIAGCQMVKATRAPGDICQSQWECTTKFCRGGTCANPLPAGSTCTGNEPCQAGLRCVNSKCQALQPDGAACALGTECISGACGGGQCVVSPTYTCDGKGV